MSKKLKIISKRDSFRRAGINFSSKTETVVDVKGLTDEQLEQLFNEPMLIVTEFEETFAIEISASARELVEKHGLNVDEITGTGKDGKINKSDVEDFIEAQKTTE